MRLLRKVEQSGLHEALVINSTGARTMQVADSENLRRTWGSKGCDHRSFEPEYFLSTPTGQHACTASGQTFWHGDRAINKPGLTPGN